MIKVAILGAGGYAAGELIRTLLNHPEASVILAQSESQAGKKISEVHTDLLGETELKFTERYHSDEIDVHFLCKGHGASSHIILQHPKLLEKKIIDLSQDFRLKGSHDFLYGLPEIHCKKLYSANHIANPGCFATCIQLGLIPSVHSKLISNVVSISGITGSTGAGQALSPTSHFSWRSNNASVYKPLAHQHLLEINETLNFIDPKFKEELCFIPYRGAFTRGIITTSCFTTSCSEEKLKEIYSDFYKDAAFTHVVTTNPDIKQVVGTNKCLIYPKVINGMAVVISVIDNLLKGAAGQAIQNMNLQFGIPEKTGLNLKSNVF